jgi:SAM-dependent methyltransferase
LRCTSRPSAPPPAGRCRLCGSPGLRTLYREVPISLDGTGAGFRTLLECDACHCYWSDLPAEIASPRYYPRKGLADHAVLEQGTSRFLRVRRAVEQTLGRETYTLLDVGCATGAHFSAYGDEVEKYGIEPSAAAVEAIRARGATWLGPSVDDAEEGTFDVVTCLDVIEHVAEPRPFLDALDRRVAPGGIVVISTGDIDSFSARWGGPRWAYYGLPEHCSFFSSRALRRYWVEERGYVPCLRWWSANQDIDLAYVVGFLRAVLQEAILKALPASTFRDLDRAGRARFPFFCDNMLLIFRKQREIERRSASLQSAEPAVRESSR